MLIRELHDWIINNEFCKEYFKIMCSSNQGDIQTKAIENLTNVLEINNRDKTVKQHMKDAIKIVYFLGTIGNEWGKTNETWENDGIITGGKTSIYSYASSMRGLLEKIKVKTPEELENSEQQKNASNRITKIKWAKDYLESASDQEWNNWVKEWAKPQKNKKSAEKDNESAENMKMKIVEVKAILEKACRESFPLEIEFNYRFDEADINWTQENENGIVKHVLEEYTKFKFYKKGDIQRRGCIQRFTNSANIVHKFYYDNFVIGFFDSEENYNNQNIEEVFKEFCWFVGEKANIDIINAVIKFLNGQNVLGVYSANAANETHKLNYAKNIIFYGPPGTGKTRKAKLLAYNILMKDTENKEDKKTADEILNEVKNIIQDNENGRIKLVQFHPSYSYNDFMESIEFSEGLCQNKDKIFKEFANKAKNDKNGDPYVLIIDEINRANVSNVLGELLYGLEYREKEFSTAIKGEKFSVPENLYIIGTMNTADRSLQNLDYAVRRRFTFEKVSAEEPLPKNRGHAMDDCYQISDKKWFCKKMFDKVRSDVEASVARGVNAEDIMPGISYFIVEGENETERKEHLEYKMEYELIPLLKEYVKDGMFTDRRKIRNGKSLAELLKRQKEEQKKEQKVAEYEYSY